MLLTLNQVISQITTLGAAHLQIQSTGVGDFAEWQALERAYPLLWVFHETTSIGDRELVYSIRLVCADRVITGEEGDDTAGMEQEVLSDTLLILLDFLAYFQQQHAQSYKVITSASIDPFTERFNDRVAGNSVLIQIRQPFTWDACQIPQTGAAIPPSVDGLTLYDFCDPSVIARLTPSQVACLEAEYGITCVDATVTQNGNAFFTVPAGATYPLITRLDGTNNLGSFNAGTKTLSFTSNPSNLQINGAQSEIIPGNSTFNLLAKLDGVAGGVYNAGLDTLNFTTTPAILQRNAIQIKTLANASTFNLITKLDGAANNGTWDGVDTLDFTSAACSPVTFQINAVNKESLSSGSTFNLITKLDGAVNSGSYDAPTDTLSFTSSCPPVPSVSLAVSDTTPDVAQVITLTATPTDITPTGYTFFTFDGVTIQLIIQQAGAVYNWTVNRVGTYDVYVMASDGTDTVSDFVPIVATQLYEAETIAYMTAVGIADNGSITVHGITGSALWSAVNNFFVTSKATTNWLTKIKAAHLMVGGTSVTTKWNAVNPLDTNAAFRLGFFGGMTFNSNGITGNAINAYANTFLDPVSFLTSNGAGVTIYQKNTVVLSSIADKWFLGTVASGSDIFGLDGVGIDTIYHPVNDGFPPVSPSIGNFQGIFTANRTASNANSLLKNGALVVTRTTGATGRSTNPITLMALNLGLSTSGYVNANIATSIIHDGMTNAEVIEMHAAIASFNTALGR